MSGLITITRNAQNYTTSYECQQAVQQNTLPTIDTVFYYDLAYSGNFNATLEVIEANILEQVATAFGLNDGKSCLVPPVGTLWLVSVSSSPTDEIDSNYRKSVLP
jgi:hypothetical protein